MNTRRENLRDRISRLNRQLIELELPLQIELSMWSPGDGWTRYRLETSANGPIFSHRDLSPNMTITEIENTLTTLENVMWYGFDRRART